MSQKVFQSKKNKIIVTDDFLIFDQSKPIHFDDLLVIRAIKGDKSAYILVGQHRPGAWFTYINLHADDFINDLIARTGVKVIERDVIDFKPYGIIKLSDGMRIVWYNRAGVRYMYFKKDGERLVYSYIPVVFFKRDFLSTNEDDSLDKEWARHRGVVLFDPWADSTAHNESIERYESERINEPNDEWVESYGPGCWSQVKVGCLTVIVIFALLFILMFLMA